MKSKQGRDRTRLARKIAFVVLGTYTLLNIACVLGVRGMDRWNYHSRTPTPITAYQSADGELTCAEIGETIESIDERFSAEKTPPPQWKQVLGGVVAVVLLPATIYLMADSFLVYMGPPNPSQSAFTRSVKARYNRLAALSVNKRCGFVGDLFLVDNEHHKKTKGAPYP